jgi:hypothetical protein
VQAASLAPTLHHRHGGMPRSLRREGIVWPGIHHSLDKRNSKRAAPKDMYPMPATGRGPTPAHYSHPVPMDHSERYTYLYMYL